jgi:hypothetical protein
MLGTAKKFAVFAVLAAWLASSGLTWDILQVVAWANMSRANAANLSTSEAIGKTLSDKPCSLCEVVQTARSATEQTPVDKSDILKAKIKYDFNYGSGFYLTLPEVYGTIFQRDQGIYSWRLTEEVPVPPPKV